MIALLPYPNRRSPRSVPADRRSRRTTRRARWLALLAGGVGLATAPGALAQQPPTAGQTTPATRPSAAPVAPAVDGQTTPAALPPADQVLNQMLRSSPAGAARPLRPVQDPPAIDRTSGAGAVAPGAASLPVLREGTFLIDRVGRLSPSADGHSVEFVFESDGQALRDPPVIILPNLKLMAMETAARASNRDLKFRVTGMVTEYNGRNYLLLEKVLVVPEQN